MKLNFTKAIIDGLPVPEKGRGWHYDAKTSGLAVMVTSTGAKSFYLYKRIDGKPKQHMIGPYPDMTIEQARKEADRLKGAIANEQDPFEKRKQRKADPTFGELFEWYMENHAKPRKRSWKEDQYQFNRYLAQLAPLKASKVAKVDLRELHSKVGQENGHYAANRALALVRTVYSQAIKHEIIKKDNPAAGIEKFREQSRDRRITITEKDAFFQAVKEEPNEAIRDFVLLGILCGARKSNVLAMRWDEVDLGAGTWRIPETKNGIPQTIPLEAPEISILAKRKEVVSSPWVFPGPGKTGHMVEPKKGWKRILERAGIEDLRIHDLRRSLGSWMVDTGASLPVIGKTLNHMSQQTTQVYARLSQDPIRAAKKKAHEAMLDGIDLGAS